MKYFVIFLVLTGIFALQSVMISEVYAPPPPDHYVAFDYAEHVIIGTVLSVDVLSEQKSQTPSDPNTVHGFMLYEIQVDEYLKNPLSTNVIKVPGRYSTEDDPSDYIGFPYKTNQKVLLYIQKDSPDYLPGYDLRIREYESKVIEEDISKPYFLSKSNGDVRHYFPLQQMQDGISFENIQCSENLILIQKNDDAIACVKPDTKSKLIERGWITQETHTGDKMSNDNIANKETITYPRFENGVTEIINPDHESMKYKTTIPVIADTYLSRNIQQWDAAQRGELDTEYQKHGDDFYTELGRLLMKNEMQYQMDSLGIINANDNFEVMDGMQLDSLPPYIGFSSVVYATDGNYYRLQGGTFANQVNYYKTTQLQFPDTAEKLPMESILSKKQSITILPEDGNKARQEPSTLVIHMDNNRVEFFNSTPDTIRIQDSGSGRVGEEDTLDWVGPTILPHQNATMAFDKPGLIQWDARKAPDLENPLWWQTHAGGDIVVLSDDMSNFSRDAKARIAQAMLHNSDIPIVASGAGNAEKVLKISLDPAIVAVVPDAKEYYLKRAHQLVPFDVDIVVDK